MSFSIDNAISKSIYNSVYRERYSFKRYIDQLTAGYDILISREPSGEPANEVYYKLGDIEAELLALEHQRASIKENTESITNDA